jgi:hypothetical protein
MKPIMLGPLDGAKTRLAASTRPKRAGFICYLITEAQPSSVFL